MAAPARVARGRAPGLLRGALFERQTPRGDYSFSEDDKDEYEEYPEFLGGGLAKFCDFRTGIVKFSENGSRLLALPMTTASRSQTRLGRK